MNDDAAHVPGISETHLPPRPASVRALVDAEAPRRAPEVAHSDRRSTPRRYRDGTAADRPFAGFLYVGVETSRIREDPIVLRAGTPDQRRLLRQRMSMSGTIGVIGPLAGGRDAQSGVHILRENRMAKGWLVSQLANQPQLNLRLANEVVPVRRGDNLDVTILNEAVLGSTQTYLSAGATLRVGRALSSFPAGIIAYGAATVTPKPRFEFGVMASARWRLMAHNAYVGGLLTKPTGLKTEHSVTDLGVGLEVRWKGWRGSYTMVRRSVEFSPLPTGVPAKHRFVSLNLSREQWSEDPSECLVWLKEGLRLNFRLGRGGSTVSPTWTVSHTPSLAASLGVEHSLWAGRASVGYETTATAREGGPPPAGQFEHSDLFLLAKVFTVGWEPTSRSSRHKLQLRAGGGFATAKYQTTPDTGSVLEPEPSNVTEKGQSVLAGLRYGYRLGNPVSLTADIGAARLLVDRANVRRADILTFTVGIQLHPWNRDAGRR
jgi:hypothetical protein